MFYRWNFNHVPDRNVLSCIVMKAVLRLCSSGPQFILTPWCKIHRTVLAFYGFEVNLPSNDVALFYSTTVFRHNVAPHVIKVYLIEK